MIDVNQTRETLSLSLWNVLCRNRECVYTMGRLRQDSGRIWHSGGDGEMEESSREGKSFGMDVGTGKLYIQTQQDSDKMHGTHTIHTYTRFLVRERWLPLISPRE